MKTIFLRDIAKRLPNNIGLHQGELRGHKRQSEKRGILLR
jgi:hypothetical protein